MLLDPAPADFVARVERIEAEALALLEASADAALLMLIHSTGSAPQQYSATRAVLVMAVCELAAPHLAWPAERRASLRRAALTMNIAMTALQDQLALQERVLSSHQLEAIETHPARGVACLQQLGVTDALWLDAVAHHHAAPPGRLADLAPTLQLARLIQRADLFAARLSPRKLRQAMPASAAAKAAFLDENRQPDAAGAAIVKALGIHPPGSYVRLASQEIGVVLRRGERANEPQVAVIVGRNGAPLAEPVPRDTRDKAYEVSGGLAPHQVKSRPDVQRLLQL